MTNFLVVILKTYKSSFLVVIWPEGAKTKKLSTVSVYNKGDYYRELAFINIEASFLVQ